MWSRVPRNSDLRMIAMARASNNCEKQTQPIVREDATQGLWPQISVEEMKTARKSQGASHKLTLTVTVAESRLLRY
jgi:hypothetical protein